MNPSRFPFEIARLPKQRRLLGHVVSALGPIWILVSVLAGFAFLQQELVPLGVGLTAFAFLLFFAGALMSRLSVYGRRLRQPDAPTVLARDPRAPVLFLRSFRDEDIVDLTSRTGRGSIRRSEEALCDALRGIGPVVAIGRPGEYLPEAGAARLYVDDQDWQQAVRHFLEAAAAVVLVVGTSPDYGGKSTPLWSSWTDAGSCSFSHIWKKLRCEVRSGMGFRLAPESCAQRSLRK